MQRPARAPVRHDAHPPPPRQAHQDARRHALTRVYTQRFFAGSRLPARSWQHLWTVPSDAIYILRSIVVGNLQIVSGDVIIDLLPRAATFQAVLAGATLEAESSAAFDLRQELLAEEEVRLWAPVTGATVLLCGYRFVN